MAVSRFKIALATKHKSVPLHLANRAISDLLFALLSRARARHEMSLCVYSLGHLAHVCIYTSIVCIHTYSTRAAAHEIGGGKLRLLFDVSVSVRRRQRRRRRQRDDDGCSRDTRACEYVPICRSIYIYVWYTVHQKCTCIVRIVRMYSCSARSAGLIHIHYNIYSIYLRMYTCKHSAVDFPFAAIVAVVASLARVLSSRRRCRTTPGTNQQQQQAPHHRTKHKKLRTRCTRAYARQHAGTHMHDALRSSSSRPRILKGRPESCLKITPCGTLLEIRRVSTRNTTDTHTHAQHTKHTTTRRRD